MSVEHAKAPAPLAVFEGRATLLPGELAPGHPWRALPRGCDIAKCAAHSRLAIYAMRLSVAMYAGQCRHSYVAILVAITIYAAQCRRSYLVTTVQSM